MTFSRSQASRKTPQHHPPAGKKKIRVLLGKQVLYAFQGSKQVFEFDCVTGASDHPTTIGMYHIMRKDRIHRSTKYNAQMNYAMFFSSDGKAIHQYHGLVPLAVVRVAKSGVSDWFGSHGCVRSPPLGGVRRWERRSAWYRVLGVRDFGRLLRRSPLRFLNRHVYRVASHDGKRLLGELEGAEASKGPRPPTRLRFCWSAST
jgi:hypothetical protein